MRYKALKALTAVEALEQARRLHDHLGADDGHLGHSEGVAESSRRRCGARKSRHCAPPWAHNFERKRRCLDICAKLLVAALVTAAVVKELRMPAEQREWHGKVCGFVPYDLRFPTIDRVRARMWDPESNAVVNPRVFGVGWTVNVGKLVKEVRAIVGAYGLREAHHS